MATLRTKYKPWLKTEYRGTEIDLPHEASHVVTNPLGEIVAYTSEPRIDGDGWAASGFMYVLGYNADPTRWWESLTPSVYLMDAAAGVKPREAKQQAYRNYWYAGGPIRVPTWAQWVAEDKHGNIVAIEGAMRPNISMYGKWAPKRNQLHVRRDRSGNGWRSGLINIDHLPPMEQYLPKGFKDELRPITYQRVELMVPSWINFITTDPNGDIHGHHKRPNIWCEHQWMSNTGSIPMCYLGYTPNRGNWKDTLLILEQKESEQKVEKEQKPKWGTQSDVELVKAWINGATIEQLADAYNMALDYIHNKLQQFGLLSPNKNGFVTAHVSNDVDETYDIEHILGVQLDGTCGEVYYLPKKEDSVELAVLVGFARGFSLKRIAEKTGIPAAKVVTSVSHSLAEASNFVNRLRFGYWGDVGELTIAQYKIDKKASPASTQRFYRGESIFFPQEYKWVVTDELGDVYAFIEKPVVATPDQPNAFWSCESGGKVLVSRNGARNNWRHSREEISELPVNAPEDWKSVQYMKLRYWVPSWVKFMAVNASGWLYGFAGKPTVGEYRWKFGAKQIDIGPSVGVILWEASLYDVENDTYLGHHGLPDQSRAQIKEDLADYSCAKGDEQHRPEFTPAESFTMVTFKLPSKTVATQEAMLTDEMFLAGVAFGMRLNKLLSKQGGSDVKEGS